MMDGKPKQPGIVPVVLTVGFVLLVVGGSLYQVGAFRGLGVEAPAATMRTVLPDAASIPDGTWRVGSEVVPGTYRALGVSAERRCYWERLSGFTGALDDVIVNGWNEPPVIVTILATDKGFTSSHCGGWTRTQ